MTTISHSIGTGDREIQSLIDRALSGLGTPMLDIQAFGELLAEARARNLSIVSVEVYELADGVELPALDLGLYFDEISAITSNLEVGARAVASLNRAQDLLLKLRGSDKEFGLQVWLE